jgi:hypothetical protein
VRGPFSLDDAAAFEALWKEADLTDVAVIEVSSSLHADSFDAWWSRTTALAAPLASLLASLPPEASTAVRARAVELARPYETDDGIDFPGVHLLASATR